MSVKSFSAADFANAEYDNALFDNAAYDYAILFDALALHADADEMNAAYDAARAANSDTASANMLAAYSVALSAAIDSRAAYELAKNADNDSMQAKLKSFKASVAHTTIASILMSCNVDANLINRNERVNARFNEKAFVKVINIARSLASVDSLNIYTRAILASVKTFEENEMMIQQVECKSACSSSARLSDTRRNSALIRVAKHYDASTCSTQASSTCNALQAFNVLRETRDAANNVCFVLNRDSAITEKLLALI